MTICLFPDSFASRALIVAAFALTACGKSAGTSTASTSPAPAPAGAPAASAPTNIWGGVYTAAQAQRGAGLFTSTCDKCHGEKAANTPEDAGRLVGREFFDLLDGVTLDQLFTQIQTTMPADNPKTLPSKDVADIISYLLSRNEFPAGASALSENPEQLKGLKIAPRP
jgi:mono/diheme cytochrome c family protein